MGVFTYRGPQNGPQCILIMIKKDPSLLETHLRYLIPWLHPGSRMMPTSEPLSLATSAV